MPGVALLSRSFFGLTALALGAATIALHSQLISNWALAGAPVFLYVTAVTQISGGVALQLPRAARAGALLLLTTYLLFACTFVPEIFVHPTVYASWGDVFYSLALVVGAGVAYASASAGDPKINGIADATVTVFGLCNISYAIEQLEFFARTASLVPKWMPLSAAFWTVATTVAFAFAGVALVIRYKAALASVLVGVMLVIFGLTIWIPLLLTQGADVGNWSEGLETFAIAGTAWLVADFLSRGSGTKRSDRQRMR